MIEGAHRPAIVGVGTTAFSRAAAESGTDLAAQALAQALADAGLGIGDIDGLMTSKVDYAGLLAHTGIRPSWISAVSPEGRMCGVAVQQAAAAIASGRATTIALVYATGGSSKAPAPGMGGGGYGAWPELSLPSGMTSPGAFYALMRQRHRHLYGTTDEQLASIPIAFRNHARRNPAAIMQKPLSVEDYLESRFIVEPFRIFDYCLVNDGAVAIIMTAGDRAADAPHTPVWVRGSAHRADFSSFDFPPDDFWATSMRDTAERALAEADRGREDLDALMVYDNFSATVLLALEGIGMCEVGEGGAFVADGALELGGGLPVNTSGGHLSGSNMQGWELNVEAVRQLRGGAAQRQVVGASTIAYACLSPVTSMVIYGVDE